MNRFIKNRQLKKGAALEMALFAVVMITALGVMLLTVAELSSVKNNKIINSKKGSAVLDKMGSDFYNALKSGSIGTFDPSSYDGFSCVVESVYFDSSTKENPDPENIYEGGHEGGEEDIPSASVDEPEAGETTTDPTPKEAEEKLPDTHPVVYMLKAYAQSGAIVSKTPSVCIFAVKEPVIDKETGKQAKDSKTGDYLYYYTLKQWSEKNMEFEDFAQGEGNSILKAAYIADFDGEEPTAETLSAWLKANYKNYRLSFNGINTEGFVNASVKNCLDLASWCKNAYENHWGYVAGTYGNILTQQLYETKCKQYPKLVAVYADFIENNLINVRTADCIGLIKSYAWYNPNEGEIFYAVNKALPEGQTVLRDYTVDGLIAAATKGQITLNQNPTDTEFKWVTRTGDSGEGKDWGIFGVDPMPDIPGLAVSFYGHVGIYVGNGEVVESCNTEMGMRKLVTFENGHFKEGVNDQTKKYGWKIWYKIPDINYDDYAGSDLQYIYTVDNTSN